MPLTIITPLVGEELLELDPDGSVLQLGPGTLYELTAVAFPAPPLNVLYSSSIDTEGEVPVSRRYGNGEISLSTEFVDAGGGLLGGLQEKIAKLQREGGELKRTMKNGDVRIYDVVAADGFSPEFDIKYYVGDLVAVSFTLPTKPLTRGAQAVPGDHVETSAPALIFSETGPIGDTDALGDLVIDEDQGVDQWWVTWGIESDRLYTHTSSSGSGALFYEAESRTLLGGSTVVTGPAGASGGGSNNTVRSATLPYLDFQAILSTQATGGGAHLSHVGSFNVYVHAQVPVTNAGTVSLALEWAQGDLGSSTRNATVALDSNLEGSWRFVSLGTVTIPSGSTQWLGRVLATSDTIVDTVDLDYLLLVPTGEGSGIATVPGRFPTSADYVGRDNWNTASASALNGTTAQMGGTWATSGMAGDFNVVLTDGGSVTRTTTSDSSSRSAALGSTNYTATLVRVDARSSAIDATSAPSMGVVARWVDASNYLFATIMPWTTFPHKVRLSKVIAGVETVLAIVELPSHVATAEWWSIALKVDTSGTATVWATRQGQLSHAAALISYYDSALAPVGALATGKPGIYDKNQVATANTRTYDNFYAAASIPDAAVFGSQSLTISHDGVHREDPTGSPGVPVTSYTGDYLRVPPAGAEGHTVRVIVKACRHPPTFMPDPAFDNISAKLYVTPRFLS